MKNEVSLDLFYERGTQDCYDTYEDLDNHLQSVKLFHHPSSQRSTNCRFALAWCDQRFSVENEQKSCVEERCR